MGEGVGVGSTVAGSGGDSMAWMVSLLEEGELVQCEELPVHRSHMH